MNFKTWRESHNLTRKEAADLLGCSQGHWSNLENGKAQSDSAESAAKAFSFYPDQWDELNSYAESMTPESLSKEIQSSSLYAFEMSEQMGLGKGSLSGYASGGVSLKDSRKITRLLIASYFISKQTQIEPVAEAVSVQVIDQKNAQESFERIQPIMIDGEPMWVVADVCRAIDHVHPSDAVKLIDEDDLAKTVVDNRIGEQWITNEPGLYTLLLRSNKPKAKPFKKWVTSEVLPSIRKTGSYQAQKTTDPLDAMILSLQEIKAAKADILQIKADLAEIKESFSPEKSAEIVMNEAQWTNNAKCWTRDCADTITAELMARGSMEGRKKLFGSFWRAHNKFVGVSSHSNICRVAEAERSMMFTRNFAQVRAINLPAFQTTINFNDLLAQKQGVQA